MASTPIAHPRSSLNNNLIGLERRDFQINPLKVSWGNFPDVPLTKPLLKTCLNKNEKKKPIGMVFLPLIVPELS